MTQSTKIWIGIGIAGMLGIILYDQWKKKKQGSAAFSNMITGKVIKPAPVLHFNGESYDPIGSQLQVGDKITVHAEQGDYYKVDCDGLYIPCDTVQLDRQFSNFIGNENEQYYNRSGL